MHNSVCSKFIFHAILSVYSEYQQRECSFKYYNTMRDLVENLEKETDTRPMHKNISTRKIDYFVDTQ